MEKTLQSIGEYGTIKHHQKGVETAMAEKFDLDQYCSKTYPQTLEEQIAFLRDHPFLKNARAARAERYADYLTPRYHFVNAEGYMNDPNGFCYWNGRYHLFFQQLVGRVMVWGHAVSRDLVHWTELPYAIHPDPTENEESSWSGGACTTKDCASIFYYGHGGHTGLYCQKSRDPLLLNWERTTRGPAIAGDTSEEETHRVPYAQYPAVYDGTVFFENGKYYAISAGVQRRADDTFTRQEYLFSSDDLASWHYEHPFLEDDAFNSIGDDGACPYLVPIGQDPDSRILLTYSHRFGPQYLLGRLDHERMKLHIIGGERISNTSMWCGYMAPAACADKDGAGVPTAVYVMHSFGHGDCMSLPHKLYLSEFPQRIRVQVSPEVFTLRRNARTVEPFTVSAGEEVVIDAARGSCTEIDVSLDLWQQNATATLKLFRSEDGRQYTALNLFPSCGDMYRLSDDWHVDCILQLDPTNGSDPKRECRASVPESIAVPLNYMQPLKLKIFLDQSVIEIFTERGRSIARRVLPPMGADTVSLTARGNSVSVREMTVYDMEPIGKTFSDGDTL